MMTAPVPTPDSVLRLCAAAAPRSPVLFVLVGVQVIAFAVGLSAVLRHGAPVNLYLSRGLMPARVNDGADPFVSPMQPLVLKVADLARGEWWRLLTYALVHYGLLHLLMNLYGHFALGTLVERMFGSIRFLVLYV